MNTKTLSITNPRSRHTYQLTATGYTSDFVWCGTGKDYAFGDIFVKMIHYGNHPQNKQKEARRDAAAEAALMERVNRCTKYAPKLYDHWDDWQQRCYVLVMQKMPGQTLRQWEEKRRVKQLDDKTVLLRSRILLQLAGILRDIHRNLPGYGHRDLKPENVMIWLDDQKKWQVALIDFGTAALKHSVKVGTYGYRAPEQETLQDNAISTGEQKDVFALAMIWHEMLSGVPAQESYKMFRPDLDELSWERRLSLPDGVISARNGKQLVRLFESMTERDPGKRPSLEQVIRMIPLK